MILDEKQHVVVIVVFLGADINFNALNAFNIFENWAPLICWRMLLYLAWIGEAAFVGNWSLNNIGDMNSLMN